MLLGIGLVWATGTEYADTAIVTAPEGWDPSPYVAVDHLPGVEGVQLEVHLTVMEGPSYRLWAAGTDGRGLKARIPLTGGRGEVAYFSTSCAGATMFVGRDGGWHMEVLDATLGLGRLVDWSHDTDTDGDGDGISDAYESGWYCSDPNDTDTDADGLDDLDDVGSGCSPLLADSDGGGVSDLEETYRYGTACYFTPDDDSTLGTADLDGDGLTNDEEFAWGTSIVEDDWDNDGLKDGEETAWGTDPFDNDTDDGGTSDGEAQWGADPLDPADDEGVAWSGGGYGAAYVLSECELLGFAVSLLPNEPGDGATPEEELAWAAARAEAEAADAAAAAECADAEARHARDTDGDGATDYDEVFAWHSDPLVADTDGDGLSDGEETTSADNWTDPTAADGDGDGLLDVEEWALGTPGWSADLDYDGLGDADEVDAGTDPTDEDSDGGGAMDTEYLYGGDPLDPADDRAFVSDPDGDRLRTLSELVNGCDPTDADTDDDGRPDVTDAYLGACTNPDVDGDGWLDGEESGMGTDPWNAADHP